MYDIRPSDQKYDYKYLIDTSGRQNNGNLQTSFRFTKIINTILCNLMCRAVIKEGRFQLANLILEVAMCTGFGNNETLYK